MAEVSSVIAKLRADLSDFTRAFQDANRTFARFKSDVEGQRIQVRLDDRGLADLKRQLARLRQDLSRGTAVLGISPAQVAREQERVERAHLDVQRRADIARLREIERQARLEARARLQVPIGPTPATAFRGSVLQAVSRNLRPQLAVPLATGAAPQVQQLAGAFAQAQRAAGRFQGGLGPLQAELRALKATLASVGVATTGVAAVMAGVRFGRSIVEAGVDMERLNNRLRTASGSAEAAARDLDFLRETSQRLGLDLVVASTGYADLIASARAANVPVAQAKQLFIGLSEAITAMQLSSEEAGGVFLAFRQIISQGGLQMQEINQLAERIPGALGLIQQALGLTGAELKKALRDGVQIPLETFLPRMNAVLGQFHADAIRGATSYTAATNRLNNAWRDLLNTLASSGILATVTRAVEQLAAAINSLANNPNVQQAGHRLARLVEGTVERIPGVELRTPAEQTQRALTSTVEQLTRERARAEGDIRALQGQLDFLEKAGKPWTARQAEALRGQLAPLEAAQRQRQHALEALQGVQAQLAPKAAEAPTAPVTFPPVPLPPPKEKHTRDAAADALKRFQEALRSLQGMTDLGLIESLDALEEKLSLLKRRLAELLEAPPTPALKQEIAGLVDQVRTLQTEIGQRKSVDAFRTAIGQALQRARDQVREAQDDLRLGLQVDADPIRQGERVLQSLEAQISATAEELKSLRAIQADPTTYPAQNAEALRAKIAELEQSYVDLNHTLDQTRGKLDVTKVLRDLGREKTELQGVLDAQRLGRLDREAEVRTQRELTRLRESQPDQPIDAAAIRAEQRAIVELEDAISNARRPLQEFYDDGVSGWVRFQEAAVQALGSVEDALVNSWSTGKLGLGDFVKSIERDLLRYFTRELVTKPLAQFTEQSILPALKGPLATLGITDTTTGKAAIPLAETTPAWMTAFQNPAWLLAFELPPWAADLKALAMGAVNTAGEAMAAQGLPRLIEDQVSFYRDFKGLTLGPDIGALDRLAASPDIPTFGAGGVVTKPTLAWVGEQGAEAIIPLQAGGVVDSGYGGIGALAAASTIQELLSLFMKDDTPKALPFKDLGGATVLGPGTLDALAHGTDPLTGVDPASSLNWSTEAEREAYLKPDTPSFWEQLLRFGLTTGAMIGGAKLGNAFGAAMTPDLFAQAGIERPAATWLSAQGITDIPQNTAWSRFIEALGFQQGGQVRGPTLALIGEAGPELVIPLKHGAVPAKLDATGLKAVMPSGQAVPIKLPQLAMGGVVGSGQPIEPPAVSRGFSPRGETAVERSSGWVVNQHFHIATPDANSFRQSENQILSQMMLALKRAEKRHG